MRLSLCAFLLFSTLVRFTTSVKPNVLFFVVDGKSFSPFLLSVLHTYAHTHALPMVLVFSVRLFLLSLMAIIRSLLLLLSLSLLAACLLLSCFISLPLYTSEPRSLARLDRLSLFEARTHTFTSPSDFPSFHLLFDPPCILTADLNPALSTYQHPVITPNFERLKARSVQFNHAYVSVSVCS